MLGAPCCVAPPCGQEPTALSRLAWHADHGALGRIQLPFLGSFKNGAPAARLLTSTKSRARKATFLTCASCWPCPNLAAKTVTALGILHSRFHELWSLRMGTSIGVGNDPRYTSTTCFETFPFPEGLTPADTAHQQTESAAGNPRPALSQRERAQNPGLP